MSGRRVGRTTVLVVIALFAAWWFASAPPNYLEIGPAVDLGGIAESILAVEAPPEALGLALERVDSDVPGHDDLLLREQDGVAFVSGMDGWIWRVPLAGGGEPFADVPLMPSGLRAAPDDDDVLYFCASRLHGEEHPEDERVGLYRLTISTRQVTPVVTDVAMTPAIPKRHRKVFAATDAGAPAVVHTAIDGTNSRPLAFCNDLDVSADGKRIYFTEPIAYAGASMGGGAVAEAITLGENGRLWRHDLENGETRLMAEGFHFIDGILIDPHPVDAREESVLVTQTPGFAITRFFFTGSRAGTAEAIWTGLPGMPDGMDRDAQGRIWIGLYRKRSKFPDLGAQQPLDQTPDVAFAPRATASAKRNRAPRPEPRRRHAALLRHPRRTPSRGRRGRHPRNRAPLHRELRPRPTWPHPHELPRDGLNRVVRGVSRK